MALGNIRAQRIQSLDDANAIPEAPACKLRYPQARDFVLSDVPWNFAGKIAVLALLTWEPDEWLYAYTWPDDCLTPRYIVPPGKERYQADRIEYESAVSSTGTRVILTNLAEASLKYTFRQTNPNRFSAHFIEALSWYLAAVIAIPVVGSEKGRLLRDDALSMYQATIGAGISADATEGYSLQRLPDTIEARQ